MTKCKVKSFHQRMNAGGMRGSTESVRSLGWTDEACRQAVERRYVTTETPPDSRLLDPHSSRPANVNERAAGTHDTAPRMPAARVPGRSGHLPPSFWRYVVEPRRHGRRGRAGPGGTDGCRRNTAASGISLMAIHVSMLNVWENVQQKKNFIPHCTPFPTS